jgi:hypothetical protein
MLPSQLTAGSFAKYPPEARQLATEHIALLRRLPLAFLPLLLRELIVYDRKFPAERTELNRQFRYLGALADAPFQIPTLGAYFGFDARFSSGKPVAEVA